MLRKVAVFLAIWLVFSCRPSFSQSQQPPSPYEGAPFSLSAAAIRTASAANLPDKLSDATILYVEADYRFAQNGALTYTNRMVYRVETQKAVQDYAEIALEWDPWYHSKNFLHNASSNQKARICDVPTDVVWDWLKSANRRCMNYLR